MTADEALAWVEEHDVDVDRQDKLYKQCDAWTVTHGGTKTRQASGRTLVEAVTRLKAKLEAR